MNNILRQDRFRLSHRERFVRQMHFQTIDRGVHWEFGYWDETMERWHNEGLPKTITRSEGRGSVEGISVLTRRGMFRFQSSLSRRFQVRLRSWRKRRTQE